MLRLALTLAPARALAGAVARALATAVAGALLVGVRARESVARRLVFHGAPPFRSFVKEGLLQVRGRQLGRWCGVVGQRVEERRPGSVVSRGQRRDPAFCPVDREHAPVERRTVAELRDDLAGDGDDPDRGPVIRGCRFVRTRIATREVFMPGHELGFDPIDESYLRGEPHHGAGSEGLLDLDRERRQARGRDRRHISGWWMVRELVKRRRPALRDTSIANREHSAWDGLHEEDAPAVRRIGRWAAGKRVAPRNRIPQIRPNLACHRDGPHVTLRRITDDPCCAGVARVVWITWVGLYRSTHMKVFLERHELRVDPIDATDLLVQRADNRDCVVALDRRRQWSGAAIGC